MYTNVLTIKTTGTGNCGVPAWKICKIYGHVDVGTCPHQVLAATLTLSQPGWWGADYAPAMEKGCKNCGVSRQFGQNI